MKWSQRFKIALKTGAFNEDDYNTATSWKHCAVGDNLRRSGCNMSHTSDAIGRHVGDCDDYLSGKGFEFTKAVSDSLEMPSKRHLYHSEANYRRACIRRVRKAQKIYNEIQGEEIDPVIKEYLNGQRQF